MDAAILQKTLARIERLGAISDLPDRLSRSFLSPANRLAARCVLEWMAELGIEAHHDAGGSVRGIWHPPGAEGAPILLGSHFDAVTGGGKYDGALGVVAALAAIEELMGSGWKPSRPVHVLGFSDEEGVRFQSTYLGSQAVTGGIDAATLACRDADGRSVAEALDREGWREDAEEIAYRAGEACGYVELHIEQGRVLEEEGLAVAVVSGICGQSRLKISLTGLADHAGTTPMNLRRDALAGAAACVLAVESLARENPPLVATVGCLQVEPGVSNAIPQQVVWTVDLRHPVDAQRAAFLERLRQRFETIARERQLELAWQVVQENGAVDCDGALAVELLGAMKSITGAERLLPSGAGHDGVVMSRCMPVAMLFVRCRDGLSHHPEEYAAPADIAVGIDVLVEFLKRKSDE